MASEAPAMYSAALLTPTAAAAAAAAVAPQTTTQTSSADLTTSPTATVPTSTPASVTITPPNTSSTSPAAAVAAATAAAAAVAAAQVQAQPPPDTKPPVQSAAAVPTPQMPPMAAAAAFSGYAPGMVFAAPDAAVMDDQPTYVNPKQYARILKRRESRKKQTGTDVTSYTPRKRSYMHESRHKHAMQRRRGPGGRFLSKEEREAIKETATTAGQ